jgi:hypothetical protein
VPNLASCTFITIPVSFVIKATSLTLAVLEILEGKTTEYVLVTAVPLLATASPDKSEITDLITPLYSKFEILDWPEYKFDE